MSYIKYIILVLLMTICCSSMASDDSYTINEKAADSIFGIYKKVSTKDREGVLEAVERHSVTAGVDPNTVFAIAVSESSLNPRAIGSGKYSQGLMQVNTKFHKEKFKKSPLNLNENVRVGVSILKTCQDRAKGNLEKTIYCYRGLKSPKYLAEIVRLKQLRIFEPNKG